LDRVEENRQKKIKIVENKDTKHIWLINVQSRNKRKLKNVKIKKICAPSPTHVIKIGVKII
jgi:hypothetical protein